AMLDIICGGESLGPCVPGLPAALFTSYVGEDPGKLRIGVRVRRSS
ncbi:MAG: amidase, partial [Mycobacterium sp.]|nr:amidase [Mycobacterium sp.]